MGSHDKVIQTSKFPWIINGMAGLYIQAKEMSPKEKDTKSIFKSSLFWDADEVDLSRHAEYVIARILDYGNHRDVEKLLEIYPKEKICKVVRTRRGLLPKTGKYWAVKLKIPVQEVACLKKYYQKRH